MDVILASSRGKNLQGLLRKHHTRPDRIYLRAKSGATLTELNELLPGILKKWRKDPADIHVYFLAGLCDVTYRDHDTHYNHYEIYDEVIFNESPQEALDRVTTIIQSVSEDVIRLGATPCFATTPQVA